MVSSSKDQGNTVSFEYWGSQNLKKLAYAKLINAYILEEAVSVKSKYSEAVHHRCS